MELFRVVADMLNDRSAADELHPLDYRRFHGAPAAYESVHSILLGVGQFDSGSVIALGILLLIATPACRAIFVVVGFSILRDRFYAAMSVIVLIVVVLTFCTRS